MASPPSLAQLNLGSPSPPPLVPPRFRADDMPPFAPFAFNPANAQMQQQQQQQQQQQGQGQQWAYSPAPSPYSPLGQSKKQPRAALPAQWLDPDNRSLSPPTSIPSSAGTGPALQDYDLSSSGGSPPRLNGLPQGQPPLLQTPTGGISPASPDDDIIPTAIVIKNIPFNVKRETLLDIIASLNIPTPYAFNYHLDALGAFRGLAFANFRQAADADAVVAALNGFDVQGRKLRVEYKKVLQAGEKERIEREKALRRMRSLGFDRPSAQIQQPPPLPMPSASPWGSPDGMNGLDALGNMSGSPAPPGLAGGLGNGLFPSQLPQLQLPPQPAVGGLTTSVSMPLPTVSPPPVSTSPATSKNELDLNDPSTLDIYSRILVFKEDRMRDELAFSRSLTPRQRRTVHLVAQKLGVFHYSVGEGEERYAVVTRDPPESRRHTPTRTTSHSFLSPADPPASGPSLASLRLKKSMPSLRPSPSSSSNPSSSHSAFLSSYLSPPQTLAMRRSNSNLHSSSSLSPSNSSNPAGHFATISTATAPRRASDFGALYGTPILPPVPVPPVPSLPQSLRDSTPTPNGDALPTSTSNGSSVVRQPRGPASTGSGFVGLRRRESELQVGGGSVGNNASGNGSNGGLEATTHQPLEI